MLFADLLSLHLVTFLIFLFLLIISVLKLVQHSYGIGKMQTSNVGTEIKVNFVIGAALVDT